MPRKRRNNASIADGCAACILAPFYIVIWPFQIFFQAVKWFIDWASSDSGSKPAATSLPPLKLNKQGSSGRSSSALAYDRFTEIIPDGRRSNLSTSITVTFFQDPTGQSFVQAANEYHNRVEPEVLRIPFQQYWPTYGAMSVEQKRWYFYWRSQYRKGNALETDLSYLFVYVYEILNLVEYSDPVEAAGRLWNLWTTYRKAYPKLDHYLPEWGADLLAVHKDLAAGLLWWDHAIPALSQVPPDIANLVIQRIVDGKKTEVLPNSVLRAIVDRRSWNAYYKKNNQNGRLDGAYRRAMQLAEEYHHAAYHESLFLKYTSPKMAVCRKPAFASALIGIPHPNMIEWGRARQFLSSEALREQLTGVLKYTENIYRRKDKCRGRLSSFTIHPDLAKILDAEFSKEAVAPVKIRIDTARASAIAAESDKVSEMLKALVVEEAAAPAKPLYTDLAPMRQLWRQVDELARVWIADLFRLAKANTENGGAHPIEDRKSLADSINQQAQELLGYPLLLEEAVGMRLAEDYLDELDVIMTETPPGTPLPTLATLEGSEAEWDAFFDHLSPPEIAVIQVLVETGMLTHPQLTEILKPYGALVDAALDALNEKAIDVLGHPLLSLDNDQWAAEEDDIRDVRAHLLGPEK